MMKLCLPILVLVSMLACAGDNIYRDVQGSLKSATPTTLNIPASPTPTITILGRSAEEFQTEYVENTLSTPIANFIIRKVPKKNPVMFEVKHPTLDRVVSFPFDLDATGSITLPALESGTIALIRDQIEVLSGSTVGDTAGMILGQLSSEGSANSGCSPINSVVIKNKQTGINVAVVGPYYFNNSGNAVASSGFSDTQCSYVMGNVLPGSYLLEFLDQSLEKVNEIEVIVLEGNVSFGMDIPQ
jgi:hypothetical protein